MMKIKYLNVYKQNFPFILFLLCLCIWLSMSIYGAFSDPNITIQEGANIWDECLLFHSNKSLFLFSGNMYGHQHLYHLLVYCITDSLGYNTPLDYIYVGRIISIIFALLSIITLIILIKNHIKNTNAYLITSVIGLHPLFFFYCFQAEPYSMLFFIGTFQLLTYLELEKNKAFSWFFLTISILGFFTHSYFLILLFAECINELFCYINNRKIKLLPFFTILGLIIIFSFQAYEVLGSPAKYFIDGYLIFSRTIILKMFGILFGITTVIFSDLIVYSLSIASLIIFFCFILKNRGSIPAIISIYFISLMITFIFENIYTYLSGYTYPMMRHYIHIVLPVTIIIGISISKHKKNVCLMIALILCVFTYTDYKIINTKYKYDGLSVVNYIHKKAEITGQENYLTLIDPDWAGYGLIERNISFNYVDPYTLGQIISYNSINLYSYKRAYIFQFINMSLPPLFPDEYMRAAYAFKYQIYLDSGINIGQIEDFINQKSTNKLLNNMLKNKSYKLTHFEMLFLKNKNIQTYNKNRLLLEILYPQYIPNIILRELRIEDRIADIIDTHPEISYFYLLYVNEFMVGIDYLDTTIQKTAINSMLNNHRLILKETKEFPNIKIYTFARKK
jgi:hypothetical protein